MRLPGSYGERASVNISVCTVLQGFFFLPIFLVLVLFHEHIQRLGCVEGA